MVRKLSVLALAVAAAASAGGCRNRCGWATSNTRADAPCQLAGSQVVCAEGVPVGGGFPGGVPGGVMPGGGYPPPRGNPMELPPPQPNELIPRPGVPFAPPTPAPADGGANLLPAPKMGVPVGR